MNPVGSSWRHCRQHQGMFQWLLPELHFQGKRFKNLSQKNGMPKVGQKSLGVIGPRTAFQKRVIRSPEKSKQPPRQPWIEWSVSSGWDQRQWLVVFSLCSVALAGLRNNQGSPDPFPLIPATLKAHFPYVLKLSSSLSTSTQFLWALCRSKQMSHLTESSDYRFQISKQMWWEMLGGQGVVVWIRTAPYVVGALGSYIWMFSEQGVALIDRE